MENFHFTTAETVILPLSRLENNTGQIEGLPANPRILRGKRYRLLLDGIRRHGYTTRLRELLAYPHPDKEGQYVIVAGNARLKALREAGKDTAPCKVIPAEATAAQLRAYAVKDNVQYGQWDFGRLEADWDDEELCLAGIQLPEPEPVDNAANTERDTESGKTQIAFLLTDEQKQRLYTAVAEARAEMREQGITYEENANSNGNALYYIVTSTEQEP